MSDIEKLVMTDWLSQVWSWYPAGNRH